MMSIVLLILFVVFNFYALRWLLRWLREVLASLREHPEREEAIREYAQKESLFQATGGLFGSTHSQNPAQRVMLVAGLIGCLLWADYYTIRKLWPGFLPAALSAPAKRTR